MLNMTLTMSKKLEIQ